eukprot:TRINITY_DN875_c0_g1_i4.p1 TRINITY_DN875_c0_g1~~TRINITY_DN875_c0_g1_i4.p1  ORF type:complete len:351 (-),score=-24.91 TRINITY_DN875_c0_g1_i4:2256-3308(-)
MRKSGNTIFVGNLPGDVRRSEVEDLFAKYGRIVDIDMKLPPRPPGFCFVEFEDSLEAEDAIRGRDGYEFDGRRLRVEWARGGGYRGGGRSPPLPPRRDHSNSSLRRSEYRVIVEGLPSRASWQDLKDHMRRAGDVCYVDVYRGGRGTVGVVEYTNYEDMKYAIRKLDDSEFRNPFGRAYITVREDRASRGRERYSPSVSRSYSRSRSRSRSPSRSYSRSPARRRRSSTRSPSRSPLRSPVRSPARSRSRSRSRSYDSRADRNGRDSRSPVRSRSRSVSVSPSRRRGAKRGRSVSLSPARSRSISGSRSRSRSRSRDFARGRSRSLSRSVSRSPSRQDPKRGRYSSPGSSR